MSKNVLIISGSPRKQGNSDLLCDRFLEGAEDAGHRATKVLLREKKVNYCLACDGCKANNGRCIQKDDMAEILEKIIAADILVMASPVYFYTMNAQMKAVIDRTYPVYPDIGKKDVYFIITAEDTRRESLERTVEGFRGFLDCYPGLVEKGTIYGTGASGIGAIKGSPAMDQAYAMGKSV